MQYSHYHPQSPLAKRDEFRDHHLDWITVDLSDDDVPIKGTYTWRDILHTGIHQLLYEISRVNSHPHEFSDTRLMQHARAQYSMFGEEKVNAVCNEWLYKKNAFIERITASEP